jgi:predicted enzyme related to lactoylglutathione lyase
MDSFSDLGTDVSVQLSVSDLDTTEAFYSGIIGIPVERTLLFAGYPEQLTLETEGFTLVFAEDSAVIGAHPVLQEHFSSFPRGVGVTLRFVVEGLDLIYEALIEEGIAVVSSPEQNPCGCRELWCFDPDGYLLALFEPLQA